MKNKIKRTAEAYTCRSGCDGGGDGGVGGGGGGGGEDDDKSYYMLMFSYLIYLMTLWK